MMRKTFTVFVIALIASLSLVGCSGKFWGGAAVGAAGVGAAYELRNKQQMDKLNEDYKSGNISQEEYENRKKQIEKGSIIY